MTTLSVKYAFLIINLLWRAVFVKYDNLSKLERLTGIDIDQFPHNKFIIKNFTCSSTHLPEEL